MEEMVLIHKQVLRVQGIAILGVCHDSDVGTDYFFFCYLPFPPLFPLRLIPLYYIRTIFCLHLLADSLCTIVTHPRILILGPGGCTMTHSVYVHML